MSIHHATGSDTAIAASARALRRRVLRETLTLAATGLVRGLAAAWALGHVLQGLLYGVTLADPLTFLGAEVTLLAVRGSPVTYLLEEPPGWIRSRC